MAVRWIIYFFVIFFIWLSGPTEGLAKEDSCSCEKISCGPCEMSQSLKFYTEKCEAGTKVKSCAKPVCVALDPMPEHCVAKTTGANRNIASVNSLPKSEEAELPNSQLEIGSVASVKGSAWVMSTLGKKTAVKVKTKIYESDTIITAANSGVEIEFIDTNLIFINENTKIKMTEYRKAKNVNERKALMDLEQGEVRNRVKVKYQGEKGSFYRVRSRSAVAGVRGTDFVMSYVPGSKRVTKVSTLEGVVKLFDRPSLEKAEHDRADLLLDKKSEPDSVSIEKGMFASHIVDKANVFNKADLEKLDAAGYLTPVYKLSKAQVDQLRGSNSMAGYKPKVREIKKLSQGICDKPFADYNQCAWYCENNPTGQSECRTDLSNVKCVRKRCDANGNWAEESRMPASQNFQCEPYGYRVQNCDY